MFDFRKHEKDFFIEINKARSNPKSVIPFLEKLLPLFDGNILTKPGQIPLETSEGPYAVNEAIKFLKSQPVVSPLILNSALTSAAKVHAEDIGPKGMDDHTGSDGSTPLMRIERFGKWENTVGENIDFGSKTGLDSLISFIIDDGVEGRGHRANVFNSEFKVIGIYGAPHKTFETVLVTPFAGGIVGQTSEKVNNTETTSDNQISQPKQKTVTTINYKKYESEFLKEVNRIRTDPLSYIPYLEEKLKYFKGNIYGQPGEIPLETQEGPKAVTDAINFLKKQEKLHPLEENKLLSQSAKDHVNDIGPKGLTDHIGSDSSEPKDRMERYLQWSKKNGENIDFGSKTGIDSVISFIIDDGVSSRGHRGNIFDKKFYFIGASSGYHKAFSTCLVVTFVAEIKDSKENENSKEKAKADLPKPEYSLIIDSEDKYHDDSSLYYVNPKRIKSVQLLDKNSFEKAVIKEVPNEFNSALNFNIINSKLVQGGTILIIVHQPLSVMRMLDAKTIEASLKLAGFSNTRIIDYEENNKKTLAVEGTK